MKHRDSGGTNFLQFVPKMLFALLHPSFSLNLMYSPPPLTQCQMKRWIINFSNYIIENKWTFKQWINRIFRIYSLNFKCYLNFILQNREERREDVTSLYTCLTAFWRSYIIVAIKSKMFIKYKNCMCQIIDINEQCYIHIFLQKFYFNNIKHIYFVLEE